MEISSNRINPYPLAVPEQRRDSTAAAERRYEQDKAAAEKRSEGGNNPGELISRESIQDRTSPDYTQALQQARLAKAHSAEQGTVYKGSPQPRVVQQALRTYQELSNSFEYSGIELLPRIDDYA